MIETCKSILIVTSTSNLRLSQLWCL